MRNSESSMRQNSRSQKRCQGTRREVGSRAIRGGRIRERLKGFVCAEAVSHIKNEPLRWCFLSFRSFDLVCSHAMNNGTDEVYVEDRPKVDKVEKHGEGKETTASKTCHGGYCYRKERLW